MITPADFRELYQDAGLTRREAARFLGRTDRQVRRWLTEGAPDWVGTMLRMRAGRLDEYGWQGWRIEGGRLLCADWKEGFEPGELFAWWWLRQKRFGYDRAEAMTDLQGEVKR
jgi:hypothetical protein